MDDIIKLGSKAVNYVSEKKDAIKVVAEIANVGMNMHQSYNINIQKEKDKEAREEQRRNEIIEKAEAQLAKQLLTIYEKSQLLVKIYSLTDTEFHIDEGLFTGIIESVQRAQEKRYDELNREIETWWTSCARSRGEKVNNKLKERSDEAISDLSHCLENIKKFSSQKPGDCNYGDIHDAIKYYNLANSNYIWAKAEGMKAIDSKQLSESSNKRAKAIIDSCDRVSEQFKEKIDAAKVAFEKKAVKAIYDGKTEGLNLDKFYQDKIMDLREQGTKISETEMKLRAGKMALSLISHVKEQKDEDIRLTQGNAEQYRNVLRQLTSPDDLNKPDVKSILDNIRLIDTFKNNITKEWLRDLDNKD